MSNAFHDIVLTTFGAAQTREQPENIIPPVALRWQRHNEYVASLTFICEFYQYGQF